MAHLPTVIIFFSLGSCLSQRITKVLLGTVDYDVKLSENYSQNSEMDFIGFLAHMFLQTLQIENKE